MLSYASLLAGLAATALVNSAVTPTEPGPGESYNEGANCPIRFSLDTTGTWTNVTISLMTGSNLQMVHLEDVVTGYDGTQGTGSVDWTCPKVQPNSAIYFYQFTNNGQDPTWTTRFTIASPTGESTKPTEQIVQDGTTIEYGTGALVGDGQASNSSVAGNTTISNNSSSTLPSSNSTSPYSSVSMSLSSASASSSSSSSTSSSTSSSSSSSPTSRGTSTPTTNGSTSGARQVVVQGLSVTCVLASTLLMTMTLL